PALCLPRSRVAMIVARRPSTSPSASISVQPFLMSEGLAEKVLIVRPFERSRSMPREPRGSTPDISDNSDGYGKWYYITTAFGSVRRRRNRSRQRGYRDCCSYDWAQ